MERFIQSVEKSVESENWYSAIFVALSLPDICGKLENPDSKSGVRYKAWWDSYLLGEYTSCVGPSRQTHVFLSADDAYALRCACLHEGADNISLKRVKQTLEHFHIIEPPPNGGIIHCNTVDNALQLQVDIFVADICRGVRSWLIDHQSDQGVQQRMQSMMTIRNSANGVGF